MQTRSLRRLRCYSIKQGTAQATDCQSKPAIAPGHCQHLICKHTCSDRNIDKEKLPKYTVETELLLIHRKEYYEWNQHRNAVLAYFQLVN